VRYRVVGLHCPHCAERIQGELRKTEGLEDVRVDYHTRTIKVDADRLNSVRQVLARVDPRVRILHRFSEETDHKGLSMAAVMISAALLLATGTWVYSRTGSTVGQLLVMVGYLWVGWPVIRRALMGVVKGKVFDEHFLVTIATGAAIGIGHVAEAGVVMLLFTLGEWLQARAVGRSRRMIAELLDIRPERANLVVGDQLNVVDPTTVQVGDTIVVKPGERIPLDGEVVEGESFVDTSPLTGESVPRRVGRGELVLAGTINGRGLLTVRVTRPLEQSSVSRILHLVEEAAARKAPTERFITAFARRYTPAVVVAAVAVAVVPPLLLPGARFSDWIYRALVLLVISCPCALVISVPLGYFGGLGAAARQGILIKGANFLEGLRKLHTVVFDKTGTLTEGVFEVRSVQGRYGVSPDQVLELAAAAELHSTHPIAECIRRAYGQEVACKVTQFENVAGFGVKAKVDGKVVLVGSDAFLYREGVDPAFPRERGTNVYVAQDGVCIGRILLGDRVREDAAEAVAALRRLGIRRMLVLSGDGQQAVERVARAVGIDEYVAELLPEDKVRVVERLQRGLWRARGGAKLAFVGDGINDAPVIMRSDIGIAMGALGSDAAVEAADVVLMDDRPSRVVTAVRIARRTGRIVWQNVVMSLGIKTAFLLLGTIGMTTIWGAVFADVGVTLLAVLNGARTIRSC